MRLAKQGFAPEFYGGSYSCTRKKLKVTYVAHFTVVLVDHPPLTQ